VVFAGTFTAGASDIAVHDGRLVIECDGAAPKFLEAVEHRTFAGAYAAARGQEVVYVTERCVFRLTADGLELTELAPGVDLQRDVLDRMGFAPIVGQPALMDARIFRPEPMGLRKHLLHLPFDSRFVYDAAKNVLYVNLERFEVRSLQTIDAIADRIASICEPLGRRVHAIVNYEGFEIARELEDEWANSVGAIVARWYASVTRFTTSAFLRAKLGEALSKRKLAPHVFETEEEAMATLAANSGGSAHPDGDS